MGNTWIHILVFELKYFSGGLGDSVRDFRKG